MQLAPLSLKRGAAPAAAPPPAPGCPAPAAAAAQTAAGRRSCRQRRSTRGHWGLQGEACKGTWVGGWVRGGEAGRGEPGKSVPPTARTLQALVASAHAAGGLAPSQVGPQALPLGARRTGKVVEQARRLARVGGRHRDVQDAACSQAGRRHIGTGCRAVRRCGPRAEEQCPPSKQAVPLPARLPAPILARARCHVNPRHAQRAQRGRQGGTACVRPCHAQPARLGCTQRE